MRMLDAEDVPNLGAAVFALAAQIPQIFLPYEIPTDFRTDDSMLCGVASLAERFAGGVRIVPRHPPRNVVFVVDVQDCPKS